MFETPAPQPVLTTPVHSGRRFGLRWVVAGLLVVLVASLAFAGARLLAAGQPNFDASLAAWAPATSVAYVEVHPDAPGAQHAALGAFLTHFPGFEDASRLDANLAEMYDDLLKEHSDQLGTYSKDIEPWLGDAVGVAVTKLPDLPADTSGASGASGPTRAAIAKDLRSGGILLVRITDAAAAGDWVKKTMAAKGLSVSSSQYAAAQLVTGTPTAGGPTASVAVLPDLMILGETSNVKTVVDANGKGGLAGTAGFQTAAKAVATENLAAWFVNVRQYVTWFSSVGAARGMASCPAITDTIPEWVGGAMTAESTALTSESVLPHVAGGPSTTNVRSTLPSHLPASTLLMLDRHDAGASIVQAVEKARSCAGPNAEVFDRIDSAIQGMGGWSGLTGWIGETALVVARDGDEPTGGVAVVPEDAAKADAFKTQLKNLLVLAGSNITSTEETYAGTTLTVISSPKEGAAAPKVAFAFTDDVVAFGLESWVKQVLDTKPEASLASDARFKTALDQARAENTSLAYANVTGLREWAESAMPASAAAKYERWAPWLRPFDAFAATASVGNDLDRFDTALTVK